MAKATRSEGPYAGKILRVNLTSGEFSTVNTNDYVPKYVGGYGVALKIWWDEVGPGVGAFDPENKLIFTNGLATGTPSPSAGRGEFITISPQSYPEQLASSSIGGFWPTKLKWNGYDGIIIEGKAPMPCYIRIADGEPSLVPCPDLWGTGLIDSQEVLWRRYGPDTECYSIGPAGENLVRYAIIGHGAHNATGQGGFGAVMGSKNCKAIVLNGGKHQVPIANLDYLEEAVAEFQPRTRLRPRHQHDLCDKPNNPWWEDWSGLEPVWENHALDWMGDFHNKPYDFIAKSCCTGCQGGCGFFEFRDVPLVSRPGTITHMSGCVHTKYEQMFDKNDAPSDVNFRTGLEVHWMAQNLGFGHHEIIWLLIPWLEYTKRMGLDTEQMMGMPTEVRSLDWWLKLLDMIAHRKGFGDKLANGMRRVVEELGWEKYGDPIYDGEHAFRPTAHGGHTTQPLFADGGWGYGSRGIMYEMTFPFFMPGALNWMIDTRDPHHNKWPDWVNDKFVNYVLMDEDWYGSEFPVRWAKDSIVRGILVDCLPACFVFPYRKYMGLLWDKEVGDGTRSTGLESRFYAAVTGTGTTEEEYYEMGERINALNRAILVRNHARTREMEVTEIVKMLHDRIDADLYDITVDNFYDAWGWDRKTGWPTRETLERFDLGDIADELEKIGKLG